MDSSKIVSLGTALRYLRRGDDRAKRLRLACILASAVLALALPLALAVPAAASAAPGPAAVRTVHVGFVRALRFMHRGWWCERTRPGRFVCVSSIPPPYLNVVALNMADLLWMLRHDYVCTGGVTPGWVGTPD